MKMNHSVIRTTKLVIDYDNINLSLNSTRSTNVTLSN